MYPKFPKRSVNARDILSLFLGWVAKKVLDFVWEKTKARTLKRGFLRTHVRPLANRVFRALCQMMGYSYVSDVAELEKLLLAFQGDEVLVFEPYDDKLKLVTKFLPKIVRLRMQTLYDSKETLFVLIRKHMGSLEGT